MKIKCEICGREFKNANGLRLHSRTHKNIQKEEKPTEPMEEVKNEEVMADKAETLTNVETDYTIAEVVVPGTGEVILTYSLADHGKDFVTLATNMAQRKNLEVRFK